MVVSMSIKIKIKIKVQVFKGPFVSFIVLVLRLESSESYKMFNYFISQLPDVSSPS